VILVEQLSVERLEEWLDVRNRIELDDPLELDLVRARRARNPTHVDLLAWLDGVPVGVGVYERMLDDPVSPIGRVNFRVLPEHRRRGVGTELHGAVSELGRVRGDEELEGQIVAPGPDAKAYLDHGGYRAVLRMIESRLDLASAPAAGGSRETCRIASAAEQPQVLEAAYVVALEAEPDAPDSRPWVRPASFAEWRAREIDDATFLPELSLVAFVDGEPAGYGLVARERAGVGAHLSTGVARAHRGHGVATTLKRAQVERARAAGLRELRAWNEEGNDPIRRINAKLGYRIVCEVVTYRGPLV
jgi:mycothiol synthase